MNKLLVFAAGMLTAIALLGPTFADEPPPRRERTARQVYERPAQRQLQQQTNWDGGQLGGSNGASGVNNNFIEPGAYICPLGFEFEVECFETPFSFGGTKWVFTWGVFAGYRRQFDTFVFGVEGDLHFKEGEHSAKQATSTCFEFDPVTDDCTLFREDNKAGSVKQTWDASLRLRGGVLVTPDTLLYVTGGIAFGEIKGTFHYNGSLFEFDPSIPETSFFGDTALASGKFSVIRTGWTVGAGAETEIWSGFKARAEYRYTHFGDFNVNLPVTTTCSVEIGCDTPSSNVRIDLEHSFHTFRIGLGFDLF
jgi:outer membrane immunogenic protein